ncbi:hypothetical protein ILUMI_12756 [Ignelater luminosus]|uniref:Uncharacterized protein n=1 Tax=Ignelater luminosus TaxID=2038154 RepID=A0A8K0CYZ8_IGNLU|nr:hypothetical protein ILUMI_12756 [Ignelater luminosus]
MNSLYYLSLSIFLTVVYLQAKTCAHPQPQEEDYANYATLYPEIAKKIGEEPIEIIDVVKAVLVYDSDDTTQSSQTTEPDYEVVDAQMSGQAETFQRSSKRQA